MKQECRTGQRPLATLCFAMLAVVTLSAAATIKVNPVVTKDGRVLTSFNAADSWTTETRQTLNDGQVVTFDYFLEIRRPSMLWFNSTLGDTNVKAEAKLDTLTRKYTVTLHRDGNIVKTETRDQENEVRDWLTVFENVEVAPDEPLKPNTDYYIQVKLLKFPRRDVSLWKLMPGGDSDSSGRAPFTYLR